MVVGPDDLGQGVGDRLGEALRALDAKHLGRAVGAELGGEIVRDALADHDRVAFRAELRGQAGALRDRAERVLVEGALVVQGVDQDPAHASSFLSSSHATIFSTVPLWPWPST